MSERISRRDFLKYITATGATMLAFNLISCGKNEFSSYPYDSFETPVKSGESKDFKFFRLRNNLRGFDVFINENRLKELSLEFGFPLFNPEMVRIILSPAVNLYNPREEKYDFVKVSKDGPAIIEIAGGKFLVKFREAFGKDPSTKKDEEILSIYTSVSLVFGLLQVSYLEGLMSSEETVQRSDKYVDQVLSLRILVLPSWLSFSGNRPPAGYTIFREIYSNNA